jgi:hypothetical protein
MNYDATSPTKGGIDSLSKNWSDSRPFEGT